MVGDSKDQWASHPQGGSCTLLPQCFRLWEVDYKLGQCADHHFRIVELCGAQFQKHAVGLRLVKVSQKLDMLHPAEVSTVYHIHQFMIDLWWSSQNDLSSPQGAHQMFMSNTSSFLILTTLISDPSCLTPFYPGFRRILPHPFPSCLPSAHSILFPLCLLAPCMASCG